MIPARLDEGNYYEMVACINMWNRRSSNVQGMQCSRIRVARFSLNVQYYGRVAANNGAQKKRKKEDLNVRQRL